MVTVFLNFSQNVPYRHIINMLCYNAQTASMVIFIDNVNKFTYNGDSKNQRSDLMAQTNINIRMDEDLKKDFDGLCTDLGLTMTAAFNVFAKTMVRQQRIPFEISMNVPNSETTAAIEEVEQMRKHPELYKSYNSFSELLAEVEADV